MPTKLARTRLVRVVSKELVAEKVPVYNIEVEGAHTYYIGKDGKSLLVHNECKHHGRLFGIPTADDLGINQFLTKTENRIKQWLWDVAWYGAKPYSQSPVGENWHWDKREKLNNNEGFKKLTEEQRKALAKQELKDKVDAGGQHTATIDGDTFMLYSSSMSVYHSHKGDGKDCYKYVGIEGCCREVVFDIWGNLDLSPERQGTYNYSTSETSFGACMHMLFDVFPYIRHGNCPEDSTFWLRRVHPSLWPPTTQPTE